LNTVLRVLINGAKWCSVPVGEQWSPKSTAHDRFGKWKEDGTWAGIFFRLCGIAEPASLIGWNRSSADGMFVPGKGGGEDVDHGYKGKGLTVHLLIDGNGMPLSANSGGASGSERAQVENLPDSVDIRTGRVGRPKKRPGALQADKGYDSRDFRNRIRKRGISPMIPRRSWPDRKQPVGRPPSKPIDRWKVERTFAEPIRILYLININMLKEFFRPRAYRVRGIKNPANICFCVPTARSVSGILSEAM
jgi:hypothetical protein